MKSSTLFALFLLSAIFTSYLPSATADVVLDTDGGVLQNGGQYSVLPVMRGSGGGLVVRATGNERCPLTVAQTRNELDKGIGTIISSPLRVAVIAEGHPLSISFGFFPVMPSCIPLTGDWGIVDGLPEGPAVKLAEYKNIVDGWFKIEKAHPLGYKLLFCPLLEGSTCGGIGIQTDDDGIRRLVVTKNNPLLVQFQKIGWILTKNNLLLPGSE